MEINHNIGIIYVADETTSRNSCLDMMISDLIKLPVCQKITEREDRNRVRNLLKKQKVQKLTKGKLNFILKKHYELDRALRDACAKYETVYVFFLNCSFVNARYPASLFAEWKQYGNVKFMLFFIDPIARPVSYDALRLLKSGVMDAAYSFDKKDSVECGMKYWHSPYSKILLDGGPAREYVLYLCCSTYLRSSEILQVVEACKENGIEYYFHLKCDDTQTAEIFQNIDNRIELYKDSWIPYEQVLHESLRANCILEIVRSGQLGLTLRSYEAVCYNRKLLTNNKAILDFKFYDPRFMQYFEKVEDIDWDWVREDIEVDYHYNGEFSPLRLLEDIIKSCEEK